jgi:hypothetical protein
MIEPEPESSSNIVDRAVSELRSSAAPPDLPSELFAALLQTARGTEGAVQHTAGAPAEDCHDLRSNGNTTAPFDVEPLRSVFLTRSLRSWRRIMRSPISRVAAAVIFVLALGGVALLLHGSVTAVSFAQVVEKVLQVRSYQLKETDLVGDTVERTCDRYWIAPGRIRLEIKDKDGKVQMVMIQERDSGKMKSLDLCPGEKVARVMSYVNFPTGRSFFDEAHSLMLKAQKEKAEAASLGKKMIDGRRAVGYRVMFDNNDTQEDIWVDVETQLPIRIEITMVLDDNAQGAPADGAKGNTPKKRILRSIWSDIRYNLKLDESLFSLDPPQGYKVIKHKTVVLPKQEKKSEDGSAPMNTGTLVLMGEVEEENKAESKPMNQGTLVPLGKEEGKPESKK